VLAAQDTTLRDWTHHPATSGLGPLSRARQRGLSVQSTAALPPERVPLGLLAQEVWARDAATDGQLPGQHTRGIAAQERQKWRTSLAAVGAARAACPQPHCVSVGDREAQVADLLAEVRATQDRSIADPARRRRRAALAAAPGVTALWQGFQHLAARTTMEHLVRPAPPG